MTVKTKRRPFLISSGNNKMGRMMIWSLPAGDSCPGKSKLCFDNCYARKNHFTHKTVIAAYNDNWKAAERQDFVPLMIEAIKHRTEKLFRIHAAGDFYSAEYTNKWYEICKACPDVKFYAYTRSWRIKDILSVLLKLKSLPNFKLWFSIDRETGVPTRRHKGVKYAYMQVGKDDTPNRHSQLVFRDHGLRRTIQKKINGVMVCPAENGITKITCEQCKYCFNYEPPQTKTGSVSLPVIKR